MCISNNMYPKARVDFDDTILLAGVVKNPKTGLEEHILGYYNKVSAAPAGGSNTSDFGYEFQGIEGDDFGWEFKPAPRKIGNAMLIMIPAVPGSVTAESLIPLADYPHLFEDYKTAVADRDRSMSRSADSFSFGTLGGSKSAFVVKGFDQGTYDVVVAQNARHIASVIDQVDEDKRPQLNQKLYDELALLGDQFTILLFCFSEKDASQAGCAMVRYTPQFPNLLFLPGLDGHNGEIERGDVELNHTIVLGHYQMARHAGNPVDFSDDALADAVDFYTGNTSDVRSIAPRPKRPYWALGNVIGRVLPKGTKVPQGDFLASVADVKAGKFRLRRQVPMGWANLPGNPADPAKGQKFYITETAIGPNAGAPTAAVRG